jgi:hypothetical protein
MVLLQFFKEIDEQTLCVLGISLQVGAWCSFVFSNNTLSVGMSILVVPHLKGIRNSQYTPTS